MNTRIRQIIEYYGYTTRSFEQKISVSDGTIRKFLGGKISLKTDTILKITANFPQISLDWLLLGEGEMLRKNVQNTSENIQIKNNSCKNVRQNINKNTSYNQSDKQETLEALQDAIEAQKRTIETQKELIAELRKRITEYEKSYFSE